MSPERKKDTRASWHELGFDFTQRTTLHGVRYITEETPFVLRRLLWTVVVLACVAGFLFVVISQFIYLMSRPKAVNIDVIYANELPFPTVTICNQNYFRGSRTFRMGLYDKVESFFMEDMLGTGDTGFETNTTDDCVDNQFEVRENAYLTNMFQLTIREPNFKMNVGAVETYVGITVRVCRYLCVHYHSALCNSIIYRYSTQTCHVSSLSPYMESMTGFYLAGVDTFVRNRCNGKRLTVCDFDGSPCPMYQLTEQAQRWLKRTGPSSTSGTGPHRDHTLANGYYMAIDATYPQRPKEAKLLTPYIQADQTNVCLQFAYSMRGQNLGSFKVMLLTPDRKATGVWESYRPTLAEWDVLRFPLGGGIFQILFTATVGSGPLGDIALDDVIIGPCDSFEDECKQTMAGLEYMGTLSEASTGATCVPWRDITQYMNTFPDGSAEMANSTCRNPDRDPLGPWCMTDTDGMLTKQYCNISFCSCTQEQFTCDNGLCIPRLAACDTFDDCGDMSDETRGCVTSVNCDFEQTHICGYRPAEDAVSTKWIQYSGRMRNGHLRKDATTHNYNGHYLYLDSGTSLLAYRQRIDIISPTYTPTNSTTMLSFSTYTYPDILFTEEMGNIVVYQEFGVFNRRPRLVIQASGRNDWERQRLLLPTDGRTFRVVFQAIVGRSYYSDMAIDGVTIAPSDPQTQYWPCSVHEFRCRSSGTCLDLAKTCDGENDCMDFSDEDDLICNQSMSIECQFDSGFVCGYRDESNPDVHRWERSLPGQPLAGMSNYMVFQQPNQRRAVTKRLVSPRSAGGAACLSFQHHHSVNNFTNLCPLSVYQEFNDNRTLNSRVGPRFNASTEGVWEMSFVTLDASDDHQMVFESRCSLLTESLRIRLGNIRITTDGSCEDRFANGSVSCNFTDDSCGYLDKSLDGINYQHSKGSMSTGLSLLSAKSSAEVHLLSPTFHALETSCVRMTIQTQFEYPDGERPTIAVRIVDVYNQSTLVWAIRVDYLDELRAWFPIEAGSHRFAVYAEIPKGTSLKLASVTTSGSTDQCIYEGQCAYECTPSSFSVCLPNSSVCDEVPNCWFGEDENHCGAYGPAGPAGPPRDSIIIPRISDDRDFIHWDSFLPPLPPLTVDQPGVNLRDYYFKAGHRKEDLIHRCMWAGTPCSPTDFLTEVTDSGLCHTFNSGKDGQAIRTTRNTGASSALRLILNIEEYDYMLGPHNDAGVKMFLYDHNDLPFVRDLGFGVAPGRHAMVGVKLSQMHSLSSPWGSCGKSDLPYGGNYTYAECVQQCETVAMVKACHCRDVYMPGYSEDDPPICDVTNFLNCSIKLANSIGAKASNCGCTEPCARNIYETQLSYTALSSLSVNKLLSSNPQQLYQKHLDILEVNQRITPDVFVRDLQILSNIVSDYSSILSFSLVQIWQPANSILVKVEKATLFLVTDILQSDMNSTLIGKLDHYITAFHTAFGMVRTSVNSYSTRLSVGLDVLLRVIDESIMSGKNVSNSVSYVEVVLKDLLTLEEAVSAYYDSQRAARSVFSSPSLQLSENLTYYLSAKANPENSEECQRNVDDFLNYVIPNLRATLEGLVTSGYQKTIQETWNASKLSSLHDVTQSILTPYLHKVDKCLGDYYSFLQSLSAWERDIDSQLQEVKAQFKLAGDRGATVDDILDYIDEADPLQNQQRILNDEFTLFKANSSRKINIAKLFNETSVTHAKQAINTFMSRIRLRLLEPLRRRIEAVERFATSSYISVLQHELQLSRYLAGHYDDVPLKAMTIWRRPEANLEDANRPMYAEDRYQFENTERFAQILSKKVVKELVAWYTWQAKEAVNWVEIELQQRHGDLKEGLTTANQRWTDYRKTTILGADYILENFLQVDVFFSQLKYQNVQQIKAYSGDSFFSDIGGFMGLLLGASIITLFELLDLIVYNLCRRMCGVPPRRQYSADVNQISLQNEKS